MPALNLKKLIRALLASFVIAPFIAAPAQSQLTVFDPTNLVQNALNAARALEQVRNQLTQITNQIRQLENDARNLTTLGRTFAPDIIGKLGELDALINEARGLALQVNDTRAALEGLYTGNYRGTDIATRAAQAAQQLDNARAALQTSLILQARVTEQLAEDSQILSALAGLAGRAIARRSAGARPRNGGVGAGARPACALLLRRKVGASRAAAVELTSQNA